jgi:N-acetylneuraminic acid mutarotase
MLEPRSGHAAVLLRNGKVLLVGGGPGAGQLASAELYDPQAGSWTATGSMTEARSHQTATLLRDGTVLVTGGVIFFGEGGVTVLASAELYDPETGTWSATGDMATSRFAHTATLLPDGRVLVAGRSRLGNGGSDASALSATAELYDPHTKAWTATGGMLEGRELQTATALGDGRVLVVAGINANTGRMTASAEIYNPDRGSWTATGGLGEARYYHSATLLPDGRVLVVAGTSDIAGMTASAELYDPRTGSWSPTASMSQGRCCLTGTLLPDGKVLVVGGYADNDTLASVELYDPGSGR